MKLTEILAEYRENIIDRAFDSMERAHLQHYERAGSRMSRDRLLALFKLTMECLDKRNLVPIIDYMEKVAGERFSDGYSIQELQIAVNVLEEAIWDIVLSQSSPDDLAKSIGLFTTVLGTAKDTLARTYVTLASKTKSPSLDLSSLFKGTDSYDEVQSLEED